MTRSALLSTTAGRTPRAAAAAEAAARAKRRCGAVSTFDSAIVAFSGGVDSAYLAWLTHHVLGDSAGRDRRQRQLSGASSRAGEAALRGSSASARGDPDRRARAARVPRQSGQSLLLLQARALHRSHGARARPRLRGRVRRQQRRRPRRLSAGPSGGAANSACAARSTKST